MFRVRFGHASDFKSVVHAIENLVSTGTWRITPGQIELQELTRDTEILTFVRLRAVRLSAETPALDVDDFPEKGPREINLTVWNKELARVLKASKPDDTLLLSTDVAEPKSMNLTFEGTSTGNLNSIGLPLRRSDSELLVIPEIDALATINMSSVKFAEMCLTFAKSPNSVKFHIPVDGSAFTMSSIMSKYSSREETIISIANKSEFPAGRSSTKMVETDIETIRELTVHCSVRWFKDITAAKSLSPTVNLTFFSSPNETSLMLLVDYNLASLNFSQSNVRFYISSTD